MRDLLLAVEQLSAVLLCSKVWQRAGMGYAGEKIGALSAAENAKALGASPAPPQQRIPCAARMRAGRGCNRRRPAKDTPASASGQTPQAAKPRRGRGTERIICEPQTSPM